MRRASRNAGFAVIAALVASGCSLLVSLDGLTGGSSAEGADAGRADAPDAAAEATVVADGGDAGTCADVKVDPANCGECGRVCPTGVCADGSCQPLVLAADVTNLSGVAGTPNFVAWLGCRVVDGGCPVLLWSRALDVDAGETSQNVYTTTIPRELATAGSTFVVSSNSGNAGTAHRCVPGGSCSYVLGGIQTASQIAGDSTSVYESSASGVVVCTQPLCGAFPRLLVNPVEGPFVDLTLGGAHMYWVDGKNPGKVRRALQGNDAASDAGSVPQDFATGLADPRGIALDATGVTWTERASGRVVRCPTSGCAGAPTVLFEEANSAPGRIVSDGKRLYFILQTGGRVVSCPVDGPCDAPVVVMRGLVDPQRLAFAGGYVVVADNGAGKVLAAPK